MRISASFDVSEVPDAKSWNRCYVMRYSKVADAEQPPPEANRELSGVWGMSSFRMSGYGHGERTREVPRMSDTSAADLSGAVRVRRTHLWVIGGLVLAVLVALTFVVVGRRRSALA